MVATMGDRRGVKAPLLGLVFGLSWVGLGWVDSVRIVGCGGSRNLMVKFETPAGEIRGLSFSGK